MAVPSAMLAEKNRKIAGSQFAQLSQIEFTRFTAIVPLALRAIQLI
jgi:hypothetical protein